MKLVDKAREAVAGKNKTKGWCEFIKERHDQREAKIFYDCNHPSAEYPVLGAGEPCLTKDRKRCPYLRKNNEG